MNPNLNLLPLRGQRIILRREVERSHEFTAPVGARGTVIYVDDREIHVTMDNPLHDGQDSHLLAWNSEEKTNVSMLNEFWADCNPA